MTDHYILLKSLSGVLYRHLGLLGLSSLKDTMVEIVTVTVAPYVRMMKNLRPEIDRLENSGNIWFQQDGATAHTERIIMALLREMFPGRLISRLGDVTCSYTQTWGFPI